MNLSGERHVIASCVEVAGAAHTHRVLLGCGLTVDVHDEDEPWHLQSRWHTASDDEVGCPGCCAFLDRGHPLPEHIMPSHTPHRTMLADIPTGLPCPQEGCGAPLYIRRKDGSVGCTASGHDFTVPEVLATSMGLLRRLATWKE